MTDMIDSNSERGFSLLEILISLSITVLLFVVFLDAMSTSLSNWTAGKSVVQNTAITHQLHPILDQKLKYAERINDISLSSNTEGYLQYTDSFDTLITVFYNSSANQTRFQATNTYSTSNIMAVYHKNGVTSNAETLLQHITQFSITSYLEDSSYYQIASANNTLSIPALDTIQSIRFVINRTHEGQDELLENLVQLNRTAISFTGDDTVGDESNPFSSHADYTFENTTTYPDGGTTSDGLRLSSPNLTVKIQNTGLYFSSIQSALDASHSGDTILIADKGSPYVESLLIPAGRTLKGGYNPITWERNIATYQTTIQPQSGLSAFAGLSTTLFLKNNTTLDGVRIDGNDLEYAIYGTGLTNVTITNCTIVNCDIGIFFNNTSGDISNNSVTANETALFIQNTSNDTTIARNRFESTNLVEEHTIIVLESSHLYFYNNLCSFGYNTLQITDSSTLVLLNNMFTLAQNFGVFFQDSTNIVFHNNVVAKNNIGIIAAFSEENESPNVSIQYNFFANNVFGHDLNTPLDNTNITRTIAESTWGSSNPFFIDLIDYELQIGSESIIDLGNPASTLSDLYIANNPSKGTTRNDIGLYGGFYAGRIGSPEVHTITPVDDIQTIVTNAYPGDMIALTEGTFTLNTPLTIKNFSSFSGTNPDESVIINNTGSYALLLGDHASLADIMIQGTLTNHGVQTASDGTSALTNIVIQNCNRGLHINDTSTQVSFSTFFNNSTDIAVFGDQISTINYCVFSASSLSINNLSSVSCIGEYNVFHDVSTQYSGSYTTTSDVTLDDDDPLFWDSASQFFQLNPSANCIDISLNRDPGAFEYYTYTGYVLTSIYDTSIAHHYSSLDVSFGGVEGIDSTFTTVAIELWSDDASVTLSPIQVFNDNDAVTTTYDIPERMISNQLQIKFLLTSYWINRSPYINEYTLTW